MDGLSAFDIVSLISSIASLVLAIVAIWLSVVFYRLSNEASKSIGDASKQISSSVERLEKLFDKLYSDTFSIMKDTVTDMREHIWKAPAEAKKEHVDAKIKKELESEVTAIIEKQKGTELRVDKLTKELERVVEGAVNKNRKLKGDALEETILKVLPTLNNPTMNTLQKYLNASIDDIASALFQLGNKGKLIWDGYKDRGISSSERIKVVESGDE